MPRKKTSIAAKHEPRKKKAPPKPVEAPLASFVPDVPPTGTGWKISGPAMTDPTVAVTAGAQAMHDGSCDSFSVRQEAPGSWRLYVFRACHV